MSFAQLYLLHPQAFLAHKDFFKPIPSLEDGKDLAKTGVQKPSFNLLEWLSILFPQILSDRIRNRLEIDTGLLQGLERDVINGEVKNLLEMYASMKSGGTLSKIPQEWASQVKISAVETYATVLDRYTVSSAEQKVTGCKKLVQIIKKMHEKGIWSLENFRTALFEAVANSLSQMYSSAVWIGLWAKSGLLSDQTRKSIPALRFDKDETVTAYCDTVMRLQKLSELTHKEFRSLEFADAELRKIDDSRYHSHIAHALAFGSKGHWDAALTLCKIAINIADMLRKANNPKEPRKGREAAYLAAIACRRTAHAIEDLDEAEYYLSQAQNREDEGVPPDIRFSSESQAILTRRLYFRFYCHSESAISNDAHRVMESLRIIVKEAGSPVNVDVRSWILRQCYTNFFNLFLILMHLGEKQNSDVLTFLRGFEKSLDEDNRTDLQAALVSRVASICLHTVDEAEKSEVINNTLEEIKRIPPILPYDRKRLELFAALIDPHLEFASSKLAP